MRTGANLRLGALVISATLALTACGGSDSNESADNSDTDTLTIYAGRDKELVDPLIEQFRDESGIDVEVRYEASPGQILEEVDADQLRADVYFGQDAGELGLLASEGVTETLPESLTSAVKPGFTAADGSWLGVTGRARVIAYNSDALTADEVPDTVDSFTAPEWEGRVGFPPGNASFKAFVTGFRTSEGDASAKAWLEGIKANGFQEFEKNGDTLDAVNDGTIDIGLVNHYYWFEDAAELGADNMVAQLKFATAGDPGALVNVAGAALLTDSPEALTFLEYLVSPEAQQYFVDNTHEYPLIDEVAAPEGLPEIEDLTGPLNDLGDLQDLAATEAMLEEVGLL